MATPNTIIVDFFGVMHEDPQGMWLDQQGLDRQAGGFADADHLLDAGQVEYDKYVARYAELGDTTPVALQAAFATARVDPNMRRLVGGLRQAGYTTGLLSNTSREEINPLLDRNNLRRVFDDIVISGETGLRKPDPRIYHLALGRLAVRPEDAIFIDDSHDNVAAACELGMVGIRFVGYAALCDELLTLGVAEAADGHVVIANREANLAGR